MLHHAVWWKFTQRIRELLVDYTASYRRRYHYSSRIKNNSTPVPRIDESEATGKARK
jgi:hypothetical protein